MQTEQQEQIQHKRKKTVVRFLEYMKGLRLTNFDGIPYALNGNVAMNINSTRFKGYLQKKAYNELGFTLSSNQLSEIVTIFSERAYEAKKMPIFIRIAAPDDNSVYIDLIDDNNTIIEVTPHGWGIAKNPDVYFFRTENMKALPIPDTNGNIDLLKNLFGLLDERDFILLRSVLCFWLRGRPSYRATFPILNIAGAAGSGKTTKAKLLKFLIDPGIPEARNPSKDPRTLYISAKNLYILNIDNISYLENDIQDALCSIASQGGYAYKKNYTDDEEQIFESCRAIILNGISFKARPDLQSRKIDIELSNIPEGSRLTEVDIWAEAEKLRPKILGGLLTALSNALKEIKNINKKDYILPRLADFALFSVALERGNGWEEGQTIKFLKENYSSALYDIADDAPIINEIVNFVQEKNFWKGTASQLLNELNLLSNEKIQKNKHWPDNALTLAKQLVRYDDVLKNLGIDIKRTRGSYGKRLIEFKFLDKELANENFIFDDDDIPF